jgi:hypothetical protein
VRGVVADIEATKGERRGTLVSLFALPVKGHRRRRRQRFFFFLVVVDTFFFLDAERGKETKKKNAST